MRKEARWLVAFLLFLAASSPAHPRSLGREIERAVGRATAEAVKASFGVVEGGLLDAWVKGEAARVARAFPGWKFHVHLVNSAEPNAFSAPGGFIFVTWGLAEEIRSDDELAGVLAHEMAHSAEHHLAKLVGKQFVLSQILGTLKSKRYRWAREVGGWGLVLLALSDMRGSEREADAVAVRACLKAGYDPEGLALILERVSDDGPKGLSELLATHPPTSKRVARIRGLARERASPSDLCRVGRALLERGRVRRAKEIFERALERSRSCKEAAEGIVACFLRAGRLERARAEAERLGLSEGEFSRLKAEFLPKPLNVGPARVPPKSGGREGKGGKAREEAMGAAREAKRLVSELSGAIEGHQAAVQVATWSARVDLTWIAAYIEAVGLAAAFREALFSVDCAARWVERAAAEGDEGLKEAAASLRKAADLLEKAHRAVRPNILSLVLSSLSDGSISEAQLAMLQTTFLAAQKWLSRCVKEAGRALEEAGRARALAIGEALDGEFASLPQRARSLAVELAVRRVGGERAALISLLERGIPFGTACLVLAVAAESGREASELVTTLGPGGSKARLLKVRGVYAPDLAVVLDLLRRDISEVSAVARGEPRERTGRSFKAQVQS